MKHEENAMGLKTMPSLVAAADWSIHSKKRRMAIARLRKDCYEIGPPQPVGESRTMLSRLAAEAGQDAAILIAFDFPIGLPAAYARAAGLNSFREALGQFGHGKWAEFYTVSAQPTLHHPFFPPPSQIKGEYRKAQLVNALGFDHIDRLMRRCDAQTDTRMQAECMFWTMGGKQVGRAVIHAWRTIIGPAKDHVQIWPFDGQIWELLSQPGITLAEIYPGEAYSHLGFAMGAGTGLKKGDQEDRRKVANDLLRAGEQLPVQFTDAARHQIVTGFRNDDDFDAMVSLLSMLLVVTGAREGLVPDEPDILGIEGWIMGQQPYLLSCEPTASSDVDVDPDRTATVLRSISERVDDVASGVKKLRECLLADRDQKDQGAHDEQ